MEQTYTHRIYSLAQTTRRSARETDRDRQQTLRMYKHRERNTYGDRERDTEKTDKERDRVRDRQS